jgi:hypothetical protein
VRPKDALRRHCVANVEGYVRAAITDAQHRRMIEVLERTPTLLTFERSLHEQAVAGLAEALGEAWGAQDDDPAGACSTVLAEITASVWLAAVRSIVMGMRSTPPALGDEGAVHAAVQLTERVLGDLCTTLNFAAEASAAGAITRVA